MAKFPFPVTPEMIAIAIAYHNKKMIADEVLPRVTVGKKVFKFLKYALAQGFTIPDTRVGRKSQPNEVDFNATETESSVEDFGLDDPVPQDDIDNAPDNHDPLGQAVEGIMRLVELDREVRTANLVFNANSYGANNKVTLSGTDQFSDFANSDPIGMIMDALDSMIMRGNIAVIGRPVWSMLCRHPKIVKAVLGNSGDSGVARREDVAALLELDQILVGEAWVNTAKKGQAATLARTWGKHISLIHQDKTANTRNGATFGYTAQYGTRIGGHEPDSKIGLRGGQRCRAGESVKEIICADDLGYFIQNAVA